MNTIPEETFHSLEFIKIIEFTRQFCLTPYSRVYFDNIKFNIDDDVVNRILDEVTQMQDCILYDDHVPFHELEDIRPFLEKCNPEDAFLEVAEILEIKYHLETFEKINHYFEKRKIKYPFLHFYSSGISFLPDLIHNIGHKIDAQGEIYDNASPELKKLRYELADKEKQVKSQFNRLVKKYKEFTQDDIITLRDGRLVLAIQETHYHKIPGIVHGTSGSGQTYYVEPMEILKLSNDIQNLRIKERKIIIKILKELSGEIRENFQSVQYSLANLGNLDFIYSKAKLSIKLDAQKPVINFRKYYSLQNARHPLLILKIGADKVVPLNLYMGDEAKILIVTGPNAGGKTIALKTIGLVQLMTQSGFLVPVAEGSELPLVNNIFVDIGDHQSIEKDLSTFSSHVVNLQKIISSAAEESLILLDELGASTDPEEGAALGMALIDWMVDSNIYGIVTTHLGKIKGYASERNGVENGSMQFDMTALTPTYQLQIGIPGASYAFHIARQYGMDEKILERGSEYLGEEKHSIEKLIITLNNKIQTYNKKMRQLSLKQSEADGLKTLYESRASALKVERKKIRQQSLEEMDEYLRKVRFEMQNVINDLKKSAADKEKITSARAALTGYQKEISGQLEEMKVDDSLQEVHIGQIVKLKELDRKGKVITEANEKGRLWIDVDGLKMQVQMNQLVETPQDGNLTNSIVKKQTPEDISTYDTATLPEIDLRGMEALEAIEVTNEYLTQAQNSGWEEVRIIHGKGRGVLRTEVNKFLAKDKRVCEKRLGRWGEGDSGVTVVKLRK